MGMPVGPWTGVLMIAAAELSQKRVERQIAQCVTR